MVVDRHLNIDKNFVAAKTDLSTREKREEKKTRTEISLCDVAVIELTKKNQRFEFHRLASTKVACSRRSDRGAKSERAGKRRRRIFGLVHFSLVCHYLYSWNCVPPKRPPLTGNAPSHQKSRKFVAALDSCLNIQDCSVQLQTIYKAVGKQVKKLNIKQIVSTSTSVSVQLSVS